MSAEYITDGNDQTWAWVMKTSIPKIARTLLNTGECSFSKANGTKKAQFATLILAAYTHPSLSLSKILIKVKKQKHHSSQYHNIAEAPEPENVRCSGINVGSDLNPEKYQFYTKFTYITPMFCILRLHLRVSPSYHIDKGLSYFSPSIPQTSCGILDHWGNSTH